MIYSRIHATHDKSLGECLISSPMTTSVIMYVQEQRSAVIQQNSPNSVYPSNYFRGDRRLTRCLGKMANPIFWQVIICITG